MWEGGGWVCEAVVNTRGRFLPGSAEDWSREGLARRRQNWEEAVGKEASLVGTKTGTRMPSKIDATPAGPEPEVR